MRVSEGKHAVQMDVPAAAAGAAGGGAERRGRAGGRLGEAQGDLEVEG